MKYINSPAHIYPGILNNAHQKSWRFEGVWVNVCFVYMHFKRGNESEKRKFKNSSIVICFTDSSQVRE